MTKEVEDKTSACSVLSPVQSYFQLELFFISAHHRLMIHSRSQPVLSSFPLKFTPPSHHHPNTHTPQAVLFSHISTNFSQI